MRLGLFTVLFPELDLDELLGVAETLGLGAIELSSKAGRGLKHFDPEEILHSARARARFLDALKRKGIVISQLNCACNPISPAPGAEQKGKEAFEFAFRLAEKLHVDTVCSFSGCPGGGAQDITPNWITCPWPPEFREMLAWQWEEKLIPFWTWAAAEGANYGVTKLALEMHPGFCVYNPESLLKLREAAGPAIGANFDPSHLVWQGIDIPEAIGMLRGAIWHFHAKDTFVNRRNVQKNGNIDTKRYTAIENRAWTFRTVGYGMSLDAWKAIISALRMAGYDGVLSIEHEDMLLSKTEGLAKAAAFLKDLIPTQPPDQIWWA